MDPLWTELVLGDAISGRWDLVVLVGEHTPEHGDRVLVVTDGANNRQRADISLQVLELELGDGHVTFTQHYRPCSLAVVVRLVHEHLAQAQVSIVLIEDSMTTLRPA